MAKNSKRVKLSVRERKQLRLRKRIRGSSEKPRLSVFRSSKHIYCQVICDQDKSTLVSASTRDKSIESKVAALEAEGLHNDSRSNKSCAAAMAVGQLIGERLKEKGVETVVFDRNGYKYHGRVKAVAEGARAAGLIF